MVRIVIGLVVLVVGLGAAWVVRSGAKHGLVGTFTVSTTVAASEGEAEKIKEEQETRESRNAEELYKVVYDMVFLPAVGGAAVGGVMHFLPLPLGLSLIDCVLAGSALASQLAILFSAGGANFSRSFKSHSEEDDVPATTRLLNSAGWIVLIIHAALFASNSLLVWEDRFTLLTLGTLLLIRGLIGIGAATQRTR